MTCNSCSADATRAPDVPKMFFQISFNDISNDGKNSNTNIEGYTTTQKYVFLFPCVFCLCPVVTLAPQPSKKKL